MGIYRLMMVKINEYIYLSSRIFLQLSSGSETLMPGFIEQALPNELVLLKKHKKQ